MFKPVLWVSMYKMKLSSQFVEIAAMYPQLHEQQKEALIFPYSDAPLTETSPLTDQELTSIGDDLAPRLVDLIRTYPTTNFQHKQTHWKERANEIALAYGLPVVDF